MVNRHLLLVLLGTWIAFACSAVPASKGVPSVGFQNRTWSQAISMAKDFASKLTLEEKCNMTAGTNGGCVGNVFPIQRLNFNGMCYQDSPSGVGDRVPHSTAFSAGIHIAAAWDRNLAYQRAAAIATEFRGKGVHFALGPMMNMDRNARHGRDWEGFGADPYLSGENAFAYVQGCQDQGVVATAKHYICNEQETNRNPGFLATKTELDPNVRDAYSAYLDDKTMHEIYLWPFASSVAAGVGSIMCSYNQVNGTPACQNDKTLNGLLKGELGFPGNVMSDWGATKSGVQSVLGGLDIDMPRGEDLMGYALLEAVKNGSIPEGRITDMIVRNMAPYYLLGQDQGFPALNLDLDATGDNYFINRQVAAAGMILLKNVNNVLPLNLTVDRMLYVYGAAAGQSDEGYRSEGSSQHAGALYQGGGSGFVDPTYGIDPLSSLMHRGRDAHVQVRYVTNQNDYNAINGSFRDRGFSGAKCLVFISAFSSEGGDRSDLLPMDNGNQLVQTVADNCPNTIVIVNSVAQLNLEAWVDHPHVTGVLWSGMPGQEYGPALTDILFGDYNPGGRLPFTLARNDADFGTDISSSFDSNYTEGVFLDYRHFDRYNITPRYHFGYGLSYTTFAFATLDVSKADVNDEASAAFQYRRSRTRTYSNFANLDLYEPVYDVKFTLTNSGTVNGSEVPQLYLGFPAEAQQPQKVLRGFDRIYLNAGETKQVHMVLTRKDISYWNVVSQKWITAPGDYKAWISTSANNLDIKLETGFHE